MKKIYSLLILSLFSIALVGCSKNDDEVVTAIDGDYKFIGINTDLTTDINITYEGESNRVVSNIKYLSTNNAGTISIGGTKMISTNLSYSAEATINAKTYLDGALIDTQNESQNIEIPTSSGVSNYKLIGTDSIYFESGAVMVENELMPSQPMGAKYKVEGNKLIFTMNLNHLQNNVQQGASVVSKSSGKVIFMLERK